jgi:hypothetical protein
MEHSNEQNLYTERYLLNELADEERKAFEEHFFNCQVCGEDVAAAARMFAAGHSVVLDEERAKVSNIADRPRWRQWVPQTAAASVLAATLTWFAVPARIPVVLVASGQQYTLPLGQDRGPGQEAKPLPVSVPATLNFELYHPDAASFVYSIRNQKGKELFSSAVSLEQAQEAVPIQLHALPRGSYEVVIEGVRKDGTRFSIAKSAFEVIGER